MNVLGLESWICVKSRQGYMPGVQGKNQNCVYVVLKHTLILQNLHMLIAAYEQSVFVTQKCEFYSVSGRGKEFRSRNPSFEAASAQCELSVQQPDICCFYCLLLLLPLRPFILSLSLHQVSSRFLSNFLTKKSPSSKSIYYQELMPPVVSQL